MESIGAESDVWVDKSHHVGHIDLELVSWVEQDLDPSIAQEYMLGYTQLNFNSKISDLF